MNRRIVTFDLPPEPAKSQQSIPGDRELVASRRLGSVPWTLGLDRYTQLLCDSMVFDPSPYLDSIDLALIDGAHDLLQVKNDTLKVARMMRDGGLILWHDYGGKALSDPWPLIWKASEVDSRFIEYPVWLGRAPVNS